MGCSDGGATHPLFHVACPAASQFCPAKPGNGGMMSSGCFFAWPFSAPDCDTVICTNCGPPTLWQRVTLSDFAARTAGLDATGAARVTEQAHNIAAASSDPAEGPGRNRIPRG